MSVPGASVPFTITVRENFVTRLGVCRRFYRSVFSGEVDILIILHVRLLKCEVNIQNNLYLSADIAQNNTCKYSE
jgi:hypothetical protein